MVEFADFNHGPMETPMTEPTLPLIELLQKQDDGDFLRAVAEAVLQLLMEHDVEGVVGAGRYERGDGRQTWRNGYRDRELKTRLGALNLRVPKLRQGSYLPGLPRAAPDVGEGAGGCNPGGVDRRRVHSPGRRPRAGHGADRHLQEHGVEAVQGHRRAGAGVPRPADRRRLALPLARRHLPQGAPGREDRLRRRHNRHGGRHRRTARDHRLVRRPLRGGDLLDRLPAQPEEPWAAGREAGDLRRAYRPQGRDRAGLRGDLATMPRSLDQKRARPRAQGPAHRRGRRDPASLQPARQEDRRRDLAPRCRPTPRPLAQARRPDGPERGRRARLHELPGPAPHQGALMLPRCISR